MAVMAGLAAAAVDPVRVLALAVHGKTTTKMPGQGQPVRDNSLCLYVEVSDALSCGIFLFNVAGRT